MKPEQVAQAAIAMADNAGPSSFGGFDWLIALNLGMSTALALIAAMFCADLVKRLWMNRNKDRRDHPVTIFRLIMLLVGAGIFIRKGAAAAVLWKWNPADPSGTQAFLTAQRMIDPLADILHLSALALAIVTAATLIDQLRKFPWRIPIRHSLSELARPLLFASLSFMAAFGVVLTR